MPDITQTFSESWYRVANQKLSLRPGVNVRRQNFRGERWIVLENPFNNQFFRLRPAAYEFIARLRPDRTVEQAWQECMDRFPDEAPGQEAVIQLLSQLYFANLLQYDVAADSAKLFERFKRNRQREIGSRIKNVMFTRIPLLDPDQFLVRTLPFFGKFISLFGALIWFVVVGWALKLVVDNFDALKDQSQGILAPDNLILLYSGLVIVKVLHEFGHAFFCRKFGGEVHTMGIMFLIFTPVPYMDATSSWGFRERWKRVLVGAAGMIVELFVAAIAVFVWAKTGSGTVNSLAYNMIFVASVSTILFNINPLLRFDGYYILSDLIDIPNLHQRSRQQIRHLVEHYVLGVKKSESPATSRREVAWLTGFGILSGLYRIFIFASILLFVADRFLLIGIIMAAICIVSWIVIPIFSLLAYLATSPKLERCRLRAVSVTATAAAVLVVLLQFVPFPHHFRAPGVFESRQWTQTANATAGVIQKLLVQPGARVTEGQPLVQFSNAELDLQFQAAQAALAEVEARLLQAMREDSANIRPLESRRDSIAQRIARIQSDRDNLVVRARHDGVWVAPELKNAIGRWLPRGTPLGLIIKPEEMEFAATVRQEDVDRLFGQDLAGEIRIVGQAHASIAASNIRVIPAEQQTLPSPALGWAGGGNVAVATDDTSGRRAAEPFFEVRADVPVSDLSAIHGRAGSLRFELGSEPLLPRWTRSLRQLLQRRYQI